MPVLAPLLAVVLAVTPTPPPSPAAAAPLAAICDKYCDARDPALAAGDREGASAEVGRRRLALHLDDGDDMGWAFHKLAIGA